MATVGFLRDEDASYAALVILDEGTGDTIEFQRAIEFDDQDRALGQDTYCIVRGAATIYGGLESWRLIGTTLSFILTVEASDVLELPTTVEIELDDDGAAVVQEQLAAIVG